MNSSEIIGIVLIKKYGIVFLAALFGAVAHALDEIRKSGWKGWFSFSSDIIVCSFVGYAFYHFSQIVYPDVSIFATSIGSFWGTKGFSYLKDWFINSIKANIK